MLSGRNSGVECQLPKLNVVGSNPIARSNLFGCKRVVAVLSASKKWALPAFFIFYGAKWIVQVCHIARIIELVEPVVESGEMELIDVECFRGKSCWMVRIYIDKESGVGLDDCAMISGEIGDLLDINEIGRASCRERV